MGQGDNVTLNYASILRAQMAQEEESEAREAVFSTLVCLGHWDSCALWLYIRIISDSDTLPRHPGFHLFLSFEAEHRKPDALLPVSPQGCPLSSVADLN